MMPNSRPSREYAAESSRRPLLLVAALLVVGLAAAVPARAAERLAASLLSQDLGDPRVPGNAKLKVTLPPALADRVAAATADDFEVYAYPGEVADADGAAPRYRAGGIYLWRSGPDLFLDVRNMPTQERDGPARVKVVFRPDGDALAEGFAEGETRYGSEMADVVLAVDVSSSMQYNDPQKLRVTAARVFTEMAEQGGGIGRVALATFHSRAQLNTPLIPLDDAESLLAALDGVGANGLTNLDEPLRLGMRELLSKGSPRPVIILLTDGKNEGSQYRDTHMQCAEAGVRIYTVGLSDRADHDLLKEMARLTGGIYFPAPSSEDLPDIYARIAAELGKRRLLHSETLPTASGSTAVPVDGTVLRLMAMADAGADIDMVGPDGSPSPWGGGEHGTLYFSHPAPGDWQVDWREATPGVSELSLFGDTRFFLELFPPQLRDGRLALGAVLAEGERPLGDASVWAEPVAGVFAEPIELFDDGRHGDGAAGDGVYGGWLEVGVALPFAVTLRAAGESHRGERFVRQSTARADIHPSAPRPPARITLGGDVDFGVLFPGETGSAEVLVEMDAPRSKTGFIELNWDTDDLPQFYSELPIEPGRRIFDIEIAVPDDARPGDYRGEFFIGADDGAGDAGESRLRVGTVTFDAGDGVDLGVIPPGTFASREPAIPYHADKAAALEFFVEGGAELTATTTVGALTPGDGVVPVELLVTVPIGQLEGEYQGWIHLAAGPGEASLPVRWQVRAYAPPAPAEAPTLDDLPTPPALPDEQEPLPPPEPGADDWQPEPALPERPAEPSPWDKTATSVDQGLDDIPQPPGKPAVPFPSAPPAVERKKGGDSIWSAWWLYLLALLLAALILLLILAYILYRLGKSHLARFLLASAIANLILLAIFIALLSTAAGMEFASRPSVAVNLVEYEAPVDVALTDAEKDLFAATGTEGAASAASSSAAAAGGAVGEASLERTLAAAAAGTLSRTQPAPELPLADLASSGLPSAASASEADDNLLQRRDRTVGRRERALAYPDRPDLPGMAEMTEPPPLAEAEGGAHPDLGEVKLDIAAEEAPQPVWSDDRSLARPLASEEGPLLAEAPGMEAVSLDETARRVDPRGRRRSRSAMAAVTPEPRSAIPDPIRDSLEEASDADAADDRAETGVDEFRPDTRSFAAAPSGRRPGVASPPGFGSTALDTPDALPRGIALAETPRRAAPRGGPRSSRGAAPHSGASQRDPQRDIPGAALTETGAARQAESDLTEQGRGLAEWRVQSGAVRPVGPVERPNAVAPRGLGGELLDPSDQRQDSAGDLAQAALSRAGGLKNARERAARTGSEPDGPERDMPGSGATDSDKAASRAGGGRGGDGVAEARVDSPADGGSGGGSGRSDQTDSRDGDGSGRSADGRDDHDGREGGDAQRPGTGDDASRDGRPGADGDARAPGSGPPGSYPTDGGAENGPGRARGAAGPGETRFDGMEPTGRSGGGPARGGAALAGIPAASLGLGDPGTGLDVVSYRSDAGGWQRNEKRSRRRGVNVASSAVDMNSLLIVVGDFAALPDPAAGRLFAALSGRMGRGLAIEERRLRPGDHNLGDTLMALADADTAMKWSDAQVAEVLAYLGGGGHLWLDDANPARVDEALKRLATAARGEYGPLDPEHQLAEHPGARGLYLDGSLAAVATADGWRDAWRHQDPDDPATLRFLVRSLNFFLSGDAEVGIELDAGPARSGLLVDAPAERVPEVLSGGVVEPGRIWDDFGPATAAAWRMPEWSDRGAVSAISDGKGGRALKMDLAGSGRGRAAAYRVLNPPEDFSRVREITADVYYEGDSPADFSLVFTTPDGAGGWRDFETRARTLTRGWNDIAFRLDGATLRNLAAGDAGFTSAFGNPGQLGRAGFFVYRDNPGVGMVLIRDVRVHED